MRAFAGLHVLAFEDGRLKDPPRRVQRLAAVQVSATTLPATGWPLGAEG